MVPPRASGRPSPRSGRLRIVSAALLIASGCAPEAPRSMVPDPDTGRRALENALGAWEQGKPSGRLEPTTPRVQVVDTSRKAGQALDRYEILSQSAGDRFRAFSVRLHLSNPDEVRAARFLVLGIDPVLVFLEEDYQLITHWDHRMPTETEGDAP